MQLTEKVHPGIWGRALSAIGGVSGVVLASLALVTLLLNWDVGHPALPVVSSMDTKAFVGYLRDRVPELMQRYRVPGVTMAIVNDGDLVWHGAFGVAERQSGRVLEADSPMMAHSLSKSLTALCVLRLAEDGRLDLDRPVGEYVPGVPCASATVRQLLSNSGGLPLGQLGVHYAPDQPRPTAQQIALETYQETPPGTRFHYSNVGYVVLEYLVTTITQRPFNDVMRDYVFLPAGMRNSTFEWQTRFAETLPLGHDLKGQAIEHYLYPGNAAGGLFSTAGDLARFAVHAMEIPALYQSVVPLEGEYRAVAHGYGLGHFVETLPGGEPAAFHGGQGLGWMTHVHLLPERGSAIVILTNSQRSWPLIAHLLRDWSLWQAVPPVGMSRIVLAQGLVRVCAALLIVGAGWRIVYLLTAVLGGARRFSIELRMVGTRRFLQGLGCAIAFGGLVWAASRPYLFVSSVFPTLAWWLGLGVFLVAVSLGMGAILHIPLVRKA